MDKHNAMVWNVSPQNSYVKPTPKGDGIWRWNFLGVLKSWGPALLNEISFLMKETPQSWIAPSTTWRQRKGSSYKPERVLSPEQDCFGPFMLDFQTPVLWEINFSVYKLPSLCYIVMAAQMD